MDTRPNIVERIKASFYNPEKGGVRWPGLIGGLLFAFGGFQLTGGGAGGLLGISIIGLLGGLGVWAANEGYDWFQTRQAAKQTAPNAPSPAPAPGRAPTQELTSGQLPPPVTPLPTNGVGKPKGL